MQDDKKLVESYDELQSGMRVLTKNCRNCGKDHISILLNRITFKCFHTDKVESGMFETDNECFNSTRTVVARAIHNCPVSALKEKRLFRFLDFDKDSFFEQDEIKKNDFLKRVSEPKVLAEKSFKA